MARLTFFIFAALISLGVCQQCTEGWTHFEGMCYGYGNTAMAWSNAQVICESRCATLAEISSAEENNFLQAIARNKTGYCVWLGATDIFKEGDWKWSNRRDFGSFVNWGVGEPNNAQNNDENCLNLSRDLNFKWNDAVCKFKCNFICVAPTNNNLPIMEL